MNTLLNKILQCQVCKEFLPFAPKPVVQLNPISKIIIISQAPGKRVHETGIPWSDISGKKLREWMNVEDELFTTRLFFL